MSDKSLYHHKEGLPENCNQEFLKNHERRISELESVTAIEISAIEINCDAMNFDVKEHRKKVNHKYLLTDKGKECRVLVNKRYRSTERGKTFTEIASLNRRIKAMKRTNEKRSKTIITLENKMKTLEEKVKSL